MGAYIARSADYNVIAASQNATAPASNLKLDHPGRVWRSASAATITIDVQGDAKQVDCFALIGSDLTTTDNVSIAFANSASGLDSAEVVASAPGYAGSKDASFSTKTVMRFPVRQFLFARIVITLPAARFVTAQRMIIAKAADLIGIKYGAESTYKDQSIEVAGQSYSSYEEYPTVPVVKFSADRISTSDYRNVFAPLFMFAGGNKAILYVPDTISPHQHDIVFGRITLAAKAQVVNYDWYVIEMTITALAP